MYIYYIVCVWILIVMYIIFLSIEKFCENYGYNSCFWFVLYFMSSDIIKVIINIIGIWIELILVYFIIKVLCVIGSNFCKRESFYLEKYWEINIKCVFVSSYF